MITNTNLKYANTSSNYYVIMMLQKLKKIKNLQIYKFFSHFRGTKCRVKASNNRKAVVACQKHVMKRPSKRSVLVVNNTIIITHICNSLQINSIVMNYQIRYDTERYNQWVRS